MKRFFISASLMLALSFNALAGTIKVPDDYTTLNGAIAAANDGDEIVVSPGTYAGFSIYKKITVRSMFDGSNWSIIDNTQINSRIEIGPEGSGTTIRGLRITHDAFTTPPPMIQALGVYCEGDNVTIEYCIIENCAHTPRPGDPFPVGAALVGVKGIIQNNIIRNNYAKNASSLYNCEGVVRNNLFFNNLGDSSISCIFGMNEFTNNTIHNSSGVGIGLGAKMINNILWRDAKATQTSTFIYSGADPRNCLIKDYSGPGIGNITSDPKFVDPDHGDFHLQASSPCIDAGITTATVNIKADIVGVQRGLKGTSSVRGDGSCFDIGAYEYKPKPICVWLPNGGPDSIRGGDRMTVAWEMDAATAGTTILLELYSGSSKVADLGSFSNSSTADQSVVQLPATLPTSSAYTIRGVSARNHSLWFNSPMLTIIRMNGVSGRIWSRY